MVAERAQAPRSATAYVVHMLRLDNSGAVNSAPDNKKGHGARRDLSNGDLVMEGPQLRDVNVREKAISAAGAAFVSAVLVNPLDVAKTRLQAQVAGVDYNTVAWQQLPRHIESIGLEKVINGGRCPPVCPRIGNAGVAPLCSPACFQYKSTFDVFSKVIQQEGFFRLWRGTNAALAIAIHTVGIYLPCYDILREKLETAATESAPLPKPYAAASGFEVSPQATPDVPRELEILKDIIFEHSSEVQDLIRHVSESGNSLAMEDTPTEVKVPEASKSQARSLQTDTSLQASTDAEKVLFTTDDKRVIANAERQEDTSYKGDFLQHSILPTPSDSEGSEHAALWMSGPSTVPKTESLGGDVEQKEISGQEDTSVRNVVTTDHPMASLPTDTTPKDSQVPIDSKFQG